MVSQWFESVRSNQIAQVSAQLHDNPELLSATDEAGCSAAEIALSLGHEDLLRLLLEQGAASTPLLPTAIAEQPKLLSTIMEYWADIDEPIVESDGSQTTALHLTCKYGPLLSVKTLLRYGAYVDSLDSTGQTPLHTACHYLTPLVAKELLLSGANPRVLDVDGRPPMVLAALHGNDDVVNALLLLDVDPYECDFTGLNAFNACMNPALFGYECNYMNISPQEEFGVISKYTDEAAVQPVAARAINIAVALSFFYDDWELSLPQACFLNDDQIALQILTKHPESLNAADAFGWSPLHVACRCRHEELAQWLLDNGADHQAPCGIHVNELIKRHSLNLRV